jgi:hypothetical protein
MSHVPGDLVRRYARGDQDIPADQVWALEAHMETCASCRELLAAQSDSLAPLLDEIWAGIDTGAVPAKHRRIPTWIAPAVAPWLGMTMLITAMTMLLDLVGATRVPLLMLIAPVAPMLGVAMAWNKATDPAYELVTASPRSGLYLVLRRTAAVLAVIIPVLLLAGLVSDMSPALWLLPSFAFSVGVLALGGLIGTSLAAAILAGAWVLFVAGPALVESDPPMLLQPASLPVWALILTVCAVVVALRADAYARLR